MIDQYRLFRINETLRSNFYLEIIAKCAMYFVGIVATSICIGLCLMEAWIALGVFIVATLLTAAARSRNYTVNHEEPKVIGESTSDSSSPNNTLREDGGTPPLAPRLSASSSD
jgi:hypothetical protein